MRLILIFVVLISGAGRSYAQSKNIINEQRDVVIRAHFKEVPNNKQVVYRITFNKNKNQPNIVAFRVSEMTDTLCLNDSSMLFSNHDIHYATFELGSTLYIWYDSSYKTNESDFRLFKKYEILKYQSNCFLGYLKGPRDEKQKNWHYYFCENCIKIQSRKHTSKALGTYKIKVLCR